MSVMHIIIIQFYIIVQNNKTKNTKIPLLKGNLWVYISVARKANKGRV